jgi:3-dehydroquinate dehydratase
MWTSDILLSDGPNIALLGFTCNDIYAVETVDFVYIMEQYNRVRKSLKKVQTFHPSTCIGLQQY